MTRRITALICIAALAITVAVVGAVAFFARESAVAEPIAISLVEPNWNPDTAEGMTPLQTVAKDPKITNNSDEDCYAFLRVAIPVADVGVIGPDSIPVSMTDAELFSTTSVEGGAFNSSWTLVSKEIDRTNQAKVYTFSYSEPLEPGDTTHTLFDSIQLINLADGAAETDATERTIGLEAFGVQAKSFRSAEAAWTAYCAQSA